MQLPLVQPYHIDLYQVKRLITKGKQSGKGEA